MARPPRQPVFPFPDDFTCKPFGEFDICSVLLPGGVDFASVDLLESIQPAIAPLVPMFNIIESIVAVKACVEAATEMPDPTALINCLPGLRAAIDKLLKLLPQVALPIMLINLIDCIIGELEKLRRFVLGLIAQFERITAILEKAAELDNPNLNLIAICATDRLAATLSDKMKALIVLGRLLGALGGLLELIGIDSNLVPDFGKISGAALDEIIEPLDSAIESLTTLRDQIPA